MDRADVSVVGAGLAGSEAALQLARRGLRVRLFEQKPESRGEAFRSDLFAELVCSNSFRALNPENAVGLLKEEMACLGSFFMQAAELTQIPAGGALAVDRERFSAWLTEKIRENPNIDIVERRLDAIPEGEEALLLASGPLTDGGLASDLERLMGGEGLHFYDAIAPIVDIESIDMTKAFFASRYDKGGADYLNLPLDETQYKRLVRDLVAAEKVPPRPFEDPKYFEGCLPVDLMAARGEKTLAFGTMKPVGLIDPRTGRRAHAVIQLRAENADKSAFSLVGFQTRLTHGEQLRVFRTIPGLERAEFLRLGSVHRNTFLDAPRLLDERLRLKSDPRIRFAGQITGVEGYVESAACGLLAGLFIAADFSGKPLSSPPVETMLGGMLGHLARTDAPFQPSNVTLSMLPPLPKGGPRLGKRQRKQAHMERAREKLAEWIRAKFPEIQENA